MTKIFNKFTGNLICEDALLDLKELAIKNKDDLRGANLRDANLRGADLRDANLRGADLRDANLWEANLRDANLRGADLRDANLREANLRDANLWEANLWGADLWGADLRDANLRGADLRDANLWEANLRGADLWGANLWGADLWGADLWGAKIKDSEIINYKDIAGVGNSRRQLRCFLLKDNSFYFMAGCFSGTEKELIIKVKEKYGNDCEYLEAIEFLKNLCKKYKQE